MASTHAVATSSAAMAEESGPQAGPLPSKRGEIGFVEGVHTQQPAHDQPIDQVNLPARHPADHPSQVPPSDLPNEAPLPAGTSPVSSDSSSMNTVDKSTFRWRKKLPTLLGIRSPTLVLIFVQIALFTGTIVGWIFAAIALGVQINAPPPSPVGGQPPNPPDHSSSIFVHVAFAVVVIAQLVFSRAPCLPSARRALRLQTSRRSPSEFVAARASVGRRHNPYGAMEPSPPSDICSSTCCEWCRDWGCRGCGDRAASPSSIWQDTRKQTSPCRRPAQQPTCSSSRARGRS